MDDVSYTLRNKEDMEERLNRSHDLEHFKQHLYPKFLEKAGQGYVGPMPLAQMIFETICDFICIDRKAWMAISTLVMMHQTVIIDYWMDAMVDHKELAAAAASLCKIFLSEL